MSIYILGIESSCDDTSAAVIHNRKVLSNVIANQDVHSRFGGVVPELASRAHQQNIIPVIEHSLQMANITKNQLSAVSFTRGPGLLGSLLVGVSFAKSFAYALNIPLIETDHMQAHILAHFIDEPDKPLPEFPFLCLTVSGGHTQIVKVTAPLQMETIGQTIDDAAGEAFDKAAKILGLPYPGGPAIDAAAKLGNPYAFKFPKPKIPELNFSFSGLKTSFLYCIRDNLKTNPGFINVNLNDLAASIQTAIVEILVEKMILASKLTGIKQIAIAGGVSANSELRSTFQLAASENSWNIHIPAIRYTTDNAAMIAVAGYFKYLSKDFAAYDVTPYTRAVF